MRKAFAVSIFVFFGLGLCGDRSGAAFAAGLDLGKQLTDKYRDQVLSLRHPLMSHRQDYGFDGAPIGPGSEGSWTLFGRVRIDHIAADNHKLEAKATRILCWFDKNGLHQALDKERVTITVRLDHPLASEDEAMALFGRVFALTPEEIINSMPDYWRGYLTKNMFGQPQQPVFKTTDPPKDQVPVPGASADAKKNDPLPTIFHLGESSVTAPKPTYAPEPEYTEAARKRFYQGTVGLNVIVDPSGAIANPRIVHPLGFGLDDTAVATVRKWRFIPGTRNGQNVSVAVYVEVDYHLYK